MKKVTETYSLKSIVKSRSKVNLENVAQTCCDPSKFYNAFELQYKNVLPLFGAAYAAPNKGKTYYADLGLQ